MLCIVPIFSLLLLVVHAQEPCTAHHGDNYYDLSSLKSSKDYQFKSPSGKDFFINVCRPVSTDTRGIENPQDIAGFTQHEGGDFSIGHVNTSLFVQNDHPLLIMTEGSRCTNGDGMTASTAVRFICDTSVFGAGDPELVAQLPPDDDSACAFFVEWRTHVACPTHQKTGKTGFITVLAAITGTVFMLYILVGTWYNRYVLELRGFDQIPRISFIPLGGIVSSARSWIDRLRYGSSGVRGVGYRGLAEEEGMLSGPPGFLDEQDEEDLHERDAQRNEDTRPVGMDSDGVIRL